jgi:hypothetical protein
VRIKHERRFGSELDCRSELLPEHVGPSTACHRNHAKQRARLTELATEAMIERNRSGVLSGQLCSIKLTLVPLHQSPRQKSLRLLGRGRSWRPFYRHSLLKERDRLRFWRYPEIHAQNFTQTLELPDRRLPVAAVELRLHEGAARLFVGPVDFEDFFPTAGGTKLCEPAQTQPLSMRLNPFGVGILWEQVCRSDLCAVGVDFQQAARPEGNELPLGSDRLFASERTAREVNGLAKICGGRLRPQFRPKSFHDLIAMEPVLRDQCKQLHQVGPASVTPGFRGNRPPFDLHPKAPQKTHCARPRHRQLGR